MALLPPRVEFRVTTAGACQPDFLKVYGPTLGPLGVPMTDKQAFALESRLKGLPAEVRKLTKAIVPAAVSELQAGERADVSWITREVIDRDKELVVVKRKAHPRPFSP